MASTIEAGPRTASPPAKTPGTFVASVSGSTAMRPPRPVSSGAIPATSTSWPMVTITVSARSVLVCLSSNCGEKRPASSKTRVHARNATPVTLPFSVTISVGPKPG